MFFMDFGWRCTFRLAGSLAFCVNILCSYLFVSQDPTGLKEKYLRIPRARGFLRPACSAPAWKQITEQTELLIKRS